MSRGQSGTQADRMKVVNLLKTANITRSTSSHISLWRAGPKLSFRQCVTEALNHPELTAVSNN